MADSKQYMISRLRQLPRDRGVKFAPDMSSAVMVCQWHHVSGNIREATPSFKINIERSGKFKAGSGHCFACSKHINDFAVILDPSKEGSDTSFDGADTDEYVQQLYDDKTNSILLENEEETIKIPNALPWQPREHWRSIHGKLLHRIEAKLIFKEEYQTLMAYFPCVVEGKHIGGIEANLVKKGKRNYYNSKGPWVKERGLFPFDFTKALIKKRGLKTIVPVEGPRDALRCLQMGIPAVAVLGSANWSELKAELIASLGIEQILTAFDGDKAGNKVTKDVFDSFKGEYDINRFRFDRYGEGIDPGNAKREIMMKLKSYVR